MVEAVRAKRSLGQHFLVDRRYCQRIVRFLAPRKSDTIVEIGPGTGELTALLVAAADHVLAVELDRDLIRELQKRFPAELASEQLHLEHTDVLRFEWLEQLQGAKPKLIGNLPYNIATRILTKTTDIAGRFQSLTVMVQKEVARRLLALPGSGDYGYLSVLMELHFEREAGFDVPPGAFRPAPKVVSHVLRLTPRSGLSDEDARSLILAVASLAFRHPRKTLANNLKARFERNEVEAALLEVGLDPRVRPGEVGLGQYSELAKRLNP